MNDFTNPMTRLRRTCRILGLTAGVLLSSPASADAQDFEAVGRRLRAAVQAGELTTEQARVMLDALRRSAGPTDRADSDRAETDRPGNDVRLARIRERFAAAVRNGDLTREEAMQRLRRVQAEMARESERRGADPEPTETDRQRPDHQRPDRPDTDRRIEQAIRRLRTAVERGDMTSAEARSRLQKLRRELEQRPGSEAPPAGRPARPRNPGAENDRPAAAEARLRAAVERGDMTPEEARRRLRELRGRTVETPTRGR